MHEVTVYTLYKFADLPDCEALAAELRALCRRLNLTGTLLLAEEGINGTVAGPRPAIEQLLLRLRADPRLADLTGRESTAAANPFYRLKVKVKPEIVTFGRPDADPRQRVGVYIDPENWNEIISDPEVLLIDTRNEYEYRVGTFTGAVNPQTDSFTEFPDYVNRALDPDRHKKVAMFCTGGIRCEKATALLLNSGFEEVYHLRGGILSYLETVPQGESLWQGECFVFDNRVTVKHDLEPGGYKLCFGCKQPLGPEELAHPAYEEGISCPFCIARLTPEHRASLAERHRQVLLAQERGTRHIGQEQITTQAYE